LTSFDGKLYSLLLYSGVLVLMALAAVYIPLFYILAVILMPLPPALLVRRLDLRYGLAALLLAGILLFLATGHFQMVLLITLQAGPLGILLGLLFKNRVPAGRSLAVTILSSVVMTAATFALMYFLTGFNPFDPDQLDRSIFDQMKSEMAALSAEGVSPDNIRELERVMVQVEASWPVLATSSVIIWVIISSFFTYAITRFYMARQGFPVPSAVPFARWRLPWYVIWGVIAGLALLLAGDETGTAGLRRAGMILLWVTGFILAVLGASVTTFYLKRWLPFRAARVALAVGLVLVAHITVVALVTLGLTDTILNIRRLSADGRTPEEEEK
jgi:uncharacterized protein YybS (DUF2232 family)